MNPSYDYKKFAILYVDDEETARKHFVRLFKDRFRIFTAADAQEGLSVLKSREAEIGLLLTDQQMPGEKGVWLLEKARMLQPRIIRILVTAFADMDSAIAAVNAGAIYKYLSKPWNEPDMEAALKHGLEFFLVQRERDLLLHEKLSVLHNTMVADRLVSLGLLAAGLSHHIRNSLVAVKTFLDLAPAKLEDEKGDLNELRDPDFWKEYHQNAQGQIIKINNMLKELWSASESKSSTFADSLNLREVIEQICAELQPQFEEKKLQVINDVPHDLPPLQADKGKFYRLFELMLKDEIVSLPPGSRVNMSARKVADNGVAPEEVEVVISDNGVGLPKEALRLVFDPFAVRSDSPAEYGINLMACFFIVHHHGGRIDAHSEDGKGTTFTIRLPLNPAQQPAMASEDDFLQKVRWSDQLWEKLLTES